MTTGECSISLVFETLNLAHHLIIVIVVDHRMYRSWLVRGENGPVLLSHHRLRRYLGRTRQHGDFVDSHGDLMSRLELSELHYAADLLTKVPSNPRFLDDRQQFPWLLVSDLDDKHLVVVSVHTTIVLKLSEEDTHGV